MGAKVRRLYWFTQKAQRERKGCKEKINATTEGTEKMILIYKFDRIYRIMIVASSEQRGMGGKD